MKVRRCLALLAATLLLAGTCTACSATGNGCKVKVYGQNQFEPYGASVRKGPSASDKKYAQGVEPNQAVTIDGFVDSRVALYPNNPEGIQGTLWYHLLPSADHPDGGWIVDAGVRMGPTEPVPGNESSGLTGVVSIPNSCRLRAP